MVTAWRLPWLRWLPLLLPALLAFAALLPLLQAGYVADDWAILALVRHGASPFEYYFADHTATYSYRPNGMLVWYLVAAAFGDAALPQYFVQIALHALNAALLALLLLRLDCTRWTALLIGSVFALHPAAVATAAWLADRFDLLAVNGCLLLLLAVHAWIRRGSASTVCAIALAAAWAIGAKETAIVVLPVALAWLLLGRRPHRLMPMLAATLPFLAALGLRWWIFGGSGLDKVAGDPLRALQLVCGIGYWLWRLPEALLRMPPLAMTTLLGGSILLFLILCNARQFRRALQHRHAAHGLNACLLPMAGVALLLLPALPQAPISALVLGGGDPLAFAVNHRFYYLALIGLGLCLAPILNRLAEIGWHRSLVVATAVLAIAWLVGDWGHATQLRHSSASPGRMQLVGAIADAARARDEARLPDLPGQPAVGEFRCARLHRPGGKEPTRSGKRGDVLHRARQCASHLCPGRRHGGVSAPCRAHSAAPTRRRSPRAATGHERSPPAHLPRRHQPRAGRCLAQFHPAALERPCLRPDRRAPGSCRGKVAPRWQCNGIGIGQQSMQGRIALCNDHAERRKMGTTPNHADSCRLCFKATLIKWHNRHGLQKARQSCWVAK
ncbi:MAG: hypothetical protein IPH43_13030 [Xanthomonadales bacterium]|nr:hypothetical protein [Xanthomonadales bacterium]